MGAVELAHAEQIDFLLSPSAAVFGAGRHQVSSPLPLTAIWPRNLAHPLREPSVAGGLCHPLGAVLTLPATGSEMNMGRRHHPQQQGTNGTSSPLRDAALRRAGSGAHLPACLPSGRQRRGGCHSIHAWSSALTYRLTPRCGIASPKGLLLTLIGRPQGAGWSRKITTCAPTSCGVPPLALNGLIGAGVPQDLGDATCWARADRPARPGPRQTLAVVLPACSMPSVSRSTHKLLQYAERVEDLRSGSEGSASTAPSPPPATSSRRMGVRDRRCGTTVWPTPISTPCWPSSRDAALTALGEHGDIDLVQSRHICEAACKGARHCQSSLVRGLNRGQPLLA